MKNIRKTLLYFLLYNCLLILESIFILHYFEDNKMFFIFLSFILINLTIYLLFLFYKKINNIKKLEIENFKFTKFTVLQIIKILIISFLTVFLCSIIIQPNMGGDTITKITSLGFVGIIITGIIAPIFEELFFRIIIGDIMKENNIISYSLMSGILFGIMHLQYIKDDIISTIYPCIVTGLLGFIWAVEYRKTKNPFIIIGAHSLYNLIIIIINFLKI